MSDVRSLVNEIKENLNQVSASSKDEVRVMRAMLNDTSYEVDVYGKNGKTGTYNPAKEFKSMQASIISATTKISKEESENLMASYDITASQAETMVGISKEFVNTYLGCGRKLGFGGREKSNFAVSQKDVKEQTKNYPKKVGESKDGKPEYENCPKQIPSYTRLRSYSSCPSWVK